MQGKQVIEKLTHKKVQNPVARFQSNPAPQKEIVDTSTPRKAAESIDRPAARWDKKRITCPACGYFQYYYNHTLRPVRCTLCMERIEGGVDGSKSV